MKRHIPKEIQNYARQLGFNIKVTRKDSHRYKRGQMFSLFDYTKPTKKRVNYRTLQNVCESLHTWNELHWLVE